MGGSGGSVSGIGPPGGGTYSGGVMSCCGKGSVPPEYGLAIITTGNRVPDSVACGRRTWMRMRSFTPSRSSPGACAGS